MSREILPRASTRIYLGTRTTTYIFPTTTRSVNTITTVDDSSDLKNKTITDSTISVDDSKLTISDDVVTTKKVQFQLNNITENKTRVILLPDANTTLVGDDFKQTLTNKTLDNPVIKKNTYTLALPELAANDIIATQEYVNNATLGEIDTSNFITVNGIQSMNDKKLLTSVFSNNDFDLSAPTLTQDETIATESYVDASEKLYNDVSSASTSTILDSFTDTTLNSMTYTTVVDGTYLILFTSNIYAESIDQNTTFYYSAYLDNTQITSSERTIDFVISSLNSSISLHNTVSATAGQVISIKGRQKNNTNSTVITLTNRNFICVKL